MPKERLSREVIAMRIAAEMEDGWYVNLGIGIPFLVADYIPEGRMVFLQGEHGMLGMGPFAEKEIEKDLTNPGGIPIRMIPGASFFHSADSFAMIRGRHLDAVILGALQVSEKGDLANWTVPERGVGSIGGAADLVYGAKRVWVAMEHTTKDGRPKLVKECTYPLTGVACVHKVFTDIAVIDITDDGLLLKEVAPGWTPEEVQALTEAPLRVSRELREIQL